MKLISPAFTEGGKIPSLYTCQGKSINPELVISGVPEKAQTLVLIIEDPDVPKSLRPDGMYDHWVVFNIPPHTRTIPAHSVPPGIQGKSTNGKNEYVGPCPPDREHRYFFKLYALSTFLDLPAGSTKKEVEKAMRGHIVSECHLMGRYEKGN